MTLPILTFDERSLSPRFGYVFDAAWLEPCESILGMLWKFVRANRPDTATLVEQIGARPSDGYAGVRPCGADVDARAVARLLGIRGAVVRDSMPGNAAFADLAWCPSCMSAGYHSFIHQRAGQQRCPIHGGVLRRHCSRCGRASAYRLDAQLLDGWTRPSGVGTASRCCAPALV
jgi:hypothetical protein